MFDYLACPICFDFASRWVEDYFPGFVVESTTVKELSELAAEKDKCGDDEFVVVSWIPHGFNTEFDMKVLDMQELKLQNSKQDKALARKDASWKLGKRGFSLLITKIQSICGLGERFLEGSNMTMRVYS